MSNQSIKSGALVTRIQIHAWRILVFFVVALIATFGTITVARAVATITATKTYTLFTDADSNGVASAGDTLEYTVTISNTGTDPATALEFDDDPDPNTTYVPGSVMASPVALDDAYTAIGNVSISKVAASGILTNDFLGLNPVATITAYDALSANNGIVVVNADGSFTYNPPRGFTGADTFTYTLSNTTGSNVGMVTVTVSGMIWFIDNTSACASSCNGRLSHPYTTLAAFNTANGLSGGLDPDVNDNIFIYESATGYSGSVTLRSGQKLIGQDATATLETITGLTPPAGSASFPVMNSGNGTVTNLTSTVTLNTDVIARGFSINSTTSTGMTDPVAAITGVSVSEVDVTTTTGTGVNFSNTAGSLSFTGLTTTGGAGANLATNPSGTFTFNDVVVSSGANTAFNATGGGTINVTGASNTLATTTGQAVVMSGVSVGPSNMTFSTINVTGSPTGLDALSFSTVTGNTFNGGAVTVAGTTTSGDGISISGSATTFNFASATIDNTADAGINLAGSNGPVTFTTVNIDGTTDAGIDIATNTNVVNVNGGTIGGSNDPAGNVVDVSAGSANVTIAAALTKSTAGRIVEITGRTGTATVDISGSLACSVACTGINVQNNISGTATINFSNSAKNLNTGGSAAVTLDNNDNATINFSNGGLNIDTTAGIGFSATNGAVGVTVTGSANTIDSAGGTALNVQSTNIAAGGLNFLSISSNGAARGIALNSTGTAAGNGGLRVTGTGTTDGSGGTIQNASTRGGEFITTKDLSLTNMNFTNANSSVDGGLVGDCEDLIILNCNSALYLRDVATAATLDNLNITGTMVENGITAINVVNFKLDNSLLDGCGDAAHESCVEAQNLSGTSTVNNTEIRFSETNSFDVVNTDVNLNLTINGSTFRDTQTSGPGCPGTCNGEGGFQFRSFSLLAGTPTTTINILSSSFLRLRTQGIQVFSDHDTTINLDINSSSIDSQADIGTGIDINANTNSTLNFNITANPIIQSRGGSAVNVTAFLNGHIEGRINNNPNITVNGTGAGGTGIRVLPQEDATAVVEALNNIITMGAGNTSSPVDVQARFDTARLDIRLDNTTDADTGAVADINITAGSSTPGETNLVCAHLTGNTVTAGGPTNILRLRVSSDVVNPVRMYLQGFVEGGAGLDDDAVATWNALGNSPTATTGNINVSLSGTAVAPLAPPGGLCNVVDTPTDFVMAPGSPVVAQDQAETDTVVLAEVTNTNAKTFTASSGIAKLSKQAVWAKAPASVATAGGGSPRLFTVRPAPAQSGGIVNVVVGTLPAGESVIIKFKVDIDSPLSPPNLGQVSNQGTVTFIDGGPQSELTDDPGVGGANDPTITILPHPDLTVSKSNNVGGSTTFPTGWTWKLDVANSGGLPAAFTSGQTILTDDLPNSGLTYGTVSVTGVTNVTNSGNISCSISSNTLTCTATGATVTLGATTGAFDVEFTATPSATGTYTNPRGGGSCEVDPNNNIADEVSEANNDCNSDVVTVTASDLSISKANNVSGTAIQGSGWNWTLTTSNTGNGGALYTSGQTILTDDLPNSGLTYGSPTPGSFTNITNSGNISCSITTNTLTCVASGGSVTIGATTGQFNVVVPVTSVGFGTFDNPRAAGSCTVDPNNNALESNEANNACNTNTVTVVAPPTISKAFGAASIPLNGSTTLTFNLSNPNTGTTLNGIGFTDTLPAGLVVSTPNGLTGSCGGGTITAVAGSGSISLSGATLAASASCNFTVDVDGTTAGTKNNTTGAVTSTEGGTGLTASDSIDVVAPPTISKAFGAASIPLNGSTTLTFNLTNPNTGTTLNGIGFTDTLPAGLVVSTPNGLTGSCGGGTITAVAGSSSISLSGATLAASASCNFFVDVDGTTAGTKNNTTSAVTSTEGGTGSTTSDSIDVVAPPTISKSFGVANIPLGGTTSLSFTITNPAANAVSLTGIGFTDTLPTGLVVATPNGLTGSCGGGTITAVAGSGSISLSGATLATSASCNFSVDVEGTTEGAKVNVTDAITSTNGGTGGTATDTVTVASPPTISKTFGAASIPLNGSTTLTFNLSNTNTSITLNGIGFTDTLPAGLVVSTPNGLTGSCGGGTITAVAGSGSISLSGATLAASASCNFTVDVDGTTAGTKNNTTGAVTSTEGGTGGTASDSIDVVGPPTLTKTFGAASIPLNGSTTLTFNLTNVSPTVSQSSIAFTDTLPAGLVVSTPNGLTGSCGGGTITAVAGSSSISLSGGTLAASASCNFSVDVDGTTAGTKNNTTGAVTSTEGGTGSTASDSIEVLAPPTISKSFGVANIPLGGTTSLSFTITNPAPNVLSLTGIGFTDTLPTGLVVATPNGLTGSCGGGTITAVAGSGSISLSGATLATSASCNFSVDVEGTTEGVKNNTTSAVTSANGGTGGTASDTVTVASPPTISKTFGAASIPLNGSTTLAFNLSNGNTTVSLSGIGFTDTLPAGLVVSTPNGLTGSCGGGTITAVAGSGSISLSSATLAASASCNFSVDVDGTTAGVKNNTTGAVTSTEGGTGLTASDSIEVVAPPTISKTFGAASIPLNGSTTLTFNLTNASAAISQSSIAFTDTLPAGLVVSTPNGLTGSCGGGTITAVAGSSSISLSGATLAGSASCNFSVDVTGTTAGTKNNTTGAVTSTEGGTGGTASDSIEVLAPPTISKSFGATSIPLGTTISLSFTITNPAPNLLSLTGIGFTDTLPAGLVVATPNGLTGSCGGGTITAVAGSGSISLSGATLAASASCNFSVDVEGTTEGVKNNTTSAVTSTEGGTGGTASDTLTVASPPTISKTFGAASIPLNGSTTLAFNLSNGNATVSLSGIGFTDTLPAGLVVSTPNGLTGSCGGGTITAVAGSGSISLSGATLAASASCNFSVNVTGTTTGTKNNTTGAVTSTEGGTGLTASDSIEVVGPPTLTKTFGAATVLINNSISLTFNLSNPSTTTTLNGIGFTDTLPAGLVVSTPNGLSSTCSGTVTAVAGSGSISLSGGTLVASASCNFSVNVTGTTVGTKNNTTGAVTSTEGGTGGTASDSITVQQQPAITSADNTTFNVTVAGSFTVTTTGFPTPALTYLSVPALPASVTFVDNGDGTATLSGTPILGDGGIYVLDITASNGVVPDATQTFTLTINNNLPPAITESDPVSVTMSEDGNPTPFALTLNATDPNPDTLTWSIVSGSGPNYGTAGVSPGTGNSQTISYTPLPNYNGLDSFDVQVSDGILVDTITVNVTIQPEADSPDLIWNQSYAIQYDTWLGVLDTNAALTFASGYRKAKSGTFTIHPVVAFNKITWITYRGPDQGKARVYVDGVLKKTVDLYSPTPQWQYFVEITGLTNGKHTVVVKPLNARNVASSDNWVAVDGFKIGTKFYDDDYIGMSGLYSYGSWLGLRNPGARFKAYRLSSLKNATMKFSFDGAEFTWVTARGPAYGKAEIWVDGVLLKTVDLYRSKQQWQYRITLGALDGLTYGSHDVVIKVLGKKRSASSGTGIVSDGFEID